MLSIKRYLEARTQNPQAGAEALLRFAHVVLQGIEMHTVEGEHSEYQVFRADIHALGEKLGSEPESQEVLVVAGAVVRALQDYNRATTRFIKQQTSEFHSIMGMLTETISTMSAGSETTVSRLHTIEKQLERAAVIEDVRSLRSQLSDCLGGLREECVRHQAEVAQAMTQIRQNLSETQKQSLHDIPAVSMDACTGLPGREAAQEEIAAAYIDTHTFAVALCVVDRLSAINARFGRTIGDKVLHAYAEHLVQAVSNSDRCFRWSGPALLALVRRQAPLSPASDQLQRSLSARLQCTFTVSNRSVLIPISATWILLPLADFPTPDALHAKLDAFVYKQSPHPE